MVSSYVGDQEEYSFHVDIHVEDKIHVGLNVSNYLNTRELTGKLFIDKRMNRAISF